MSRRPHARKPSSQRWLQRQHRDPFVKQAQQSDYRSRAVFKLIEIDEKDNLFRPGQLVVDLGAAPGSWSQYAAKKTGKQGRVIAVDILPMDNIKGVSFVQGDFREQEVLDACLSALEGNKADLVISDMAPNISGIKSSDQTRSVYLAELARDLALEVLKPGGDILVKLFQGEGVDEFRKSLQEHFPRIISRNPRASRESSREFYLLGRDYRP